MLGPLDMLGAPVLGPIQMVHWLARTLIETAEGELFDSDRLKGELLELQARYDMGEVPEDEYVEAEETLLKRISAIIEARG